MMQLAKVNWILFFTWHEKKISFLEIESSSDDDDFDDSDDSDKEPVESFKSKNVQPVPTEQIKTGSHEETRQKKTFSIFRL